MPCPPPQLVPWQLPKAHPAAIQERRLRELSRFEWNLRTHLRRHRPSPAESNPEIGRTCGSGRPSLFGLSAHCPQPARPAGDGAAERRPAPATVARARTKGADQEAVASEISGMGTAGARALTWSWRPSSRAHQRPAAGLAPESFGHWHRIATATTAHRGTFAYVAETLAAEQDHSG